MNWSKLNESKLKCVLGSRGKVDDSIGTKHVRLNVEGRLILETTCLVKLKTD